MAGMDMNTAGTTDADRHIDGLVARYAVLGSQQRKLQRRKRLRRVSAAIGLVVLSGFAAQSEWSSRSLQAVAEVFELRSRMASELQAFSASHTELRRQSRWLEQQVEQLTAHLSDFERQSLALEAQRAALQEQSARVETTLAEMDAERRALMAANREQVAESATMAALAAEQQHLEQRRQTFAAQQDEVSSELDSLTQQRAALEAKRQALEDQRRELEAMLTQSRSTIQEPELNDEPLETTADEGPLFASAVNPAALGNMRGGIMLGDGMNVSIGLTRSADLNGVEQISNTVSLDGINGGLNALSMRGLESIFVQNGPNNLISSGAIEGMSNSYGTILQNTLDNQTIGTRTIFDISIQDVQRVMDGVAAGQAMRDSMSLQQ